MGNSTSRNEDDGGSQQTESSLHLGRRYCFPFASSPPDKPHTTNDDHNNDSVNDPVETTNPAQEQDYDADDDSFLSCHGEQQGLDGDGGSPENEEENDIMETPQRRFSTCGSRYAFPFLSSPPSESSSHGGGDPDDDDDVEMESSPPSKHLGRTYAFPFLSSPPASGTRTSTNDNANDGGVMRENEDHPSLAFPPSSVASNRSHRSHENDNDGKNGKGGGGDEEKERGTQNRRKEVKKTKRRQTLSLHFFSSSDEDDMNDQRNDEEKKDGEGDYKDKENRSMISTKKKFDPSTKNRSSKWAERAVPGDNTKKRKKKKKKEHHHTFQKADLKPSSLKKKKVEPATKSMEEKRVLQLDSSPEEISIVPMRQTSFPQLDSSPEGISIVPTRRTSFPQLDSSPEGISIVPMRRTSFPPLDSSPEGISIVPIRTTTDQKAKKKQKKYEKKHAPKPGPHVSILRKTTDQRATTTEKKSVWSAKHRHTSSKPATKEVLRLNLHSSDDEDEEEDDKIQCIARRPHDSSISRKKSQGSVKRALSWEGSNKTKRDAATSVSREKPEAERTTTTTTALLDEYPEFMDIALRLGNDEIIPHRPKGPSRARRNSSAQP